MHISINPTYFCNFRCSHCYLSINDLSNKDKLDFIGLKSVLNSINRHTNITHIDLYGGEIGLLSYEYLKKLESVLEGVWLGQINVITNFSNIHEYFYQDNVDITVSYDYIYREHHEKVLSNIIKFSKPIHIIVLAIDDIIDNADNDIQIMHDMFSTIGNIVSVEIKPYSANQNNSQSSTYLDYEKYVERWLKLDGNYELVNRKKIQDCIDKTSSSFSDNHLYITPNGKISVLEFKNDNEYFKELDSYEEYLEWCNKEKEKNINSICNSCKYNGHCLSEHLKIVNSLKYGCNGFINLLKRTTYDNSQNKEGFRS